jgi:hypothetical protein
MKKKITAATSREELAAIVSEHLRAAGIDAVLVGGSAVAIYTEDRFPSDDLDFVAWRARDAQRALASLGFTRFVGNRAEHPKARFYVQIVNGPVQVGNKLVKRPVLVPTAAGEIKMLSPLDCVLDRLAAFLHWNDRQCLAQAAHVAVAHDVDLAAVRAWVESEEGDRVQNRERHAEFRARVDELRNL